MRRGNEISNSTDGHNEKPQDHRENILYAFMTTYMVAIGKKMIIKGQELTAVVATERCMCVQIFFSPFLSMEWGSDCFFPISANERTIGMRLASFLWFWWWCCLSRASRILLLASWPRGPDNSCWSRTMSDEKQRTCEFHSRQRLFLGSDKLIIHTKMFPLLLI